MESKFKEVNSYESKVDSILNYVKGIVDVSDYELAMIRDSVRLITQEPPNTKLMVNSRIDEIVKAKSNMSYIMLKLKDIRRTINIPYTDFYNTNFMILTKQGRPSKAAIDSEIHALHSNCRDWRDRLSEIDLILEFFETHTDLLSSVKSTLESRRYDLG